MTTFSEDEIRFVGERLHRNLADEKIRAILQVNGSCDVQAVPGSGKTSVLSAKLTLLAGKWAYSNRGICILSHTNVAKNEIIDLLSRTNEGRQLLNPPHFVGTIQSFVDRFLALPYIHGTGLPYEAIDESRHARAAKKFFSAGKYNGTRSFLSKKSVSGDIADFAGDLEYIGSRNKIRHRSFKLPSATSNTYKNLLEVKSRVTAFGIYRYNDMYAYAHEYIDAFPWVIDSIRHRFPTAFIDEMQDTSALQFDLLSRVFDRSLQTIQRFGDRDQAIYEMESEGEAGSDFPSDPVLTLDDSKRFGPFIAEQVTALSLSSQQVLGKGTASAKPGRLLLFDKVTIKNVLPTFGDVILAEFEGERVRANAVGRRRKPGTGSNIPTSIGDYWDGYEAAIAPASESSSGFANAVRRALEFSMSQGAYYDASLALWRALKDWAGAIGVADPSGFVRALKMDWSQRRELSTSFYDLIAGVEFPTTTVWERSVSAIERILKHNAGASYKKTTFAVYPSEVPTIAPTGVQVYQHIAGDRTALIEMNTIHGVKSQTHAATILLETSVHGFDLKAIMPFLSGRKDVTAESLEPSIAATVRCGFVALSRPQSLLCIAVRSDHVTATDRRNLVNRGWQVIDVA